jgi:hypothetical protein
MTDRSHLSQEELEQVRANLGEPGFEEKLPEPYVEKPKPEKVEKTEKTESKPEKTEKDSKPSTKK